MKLAYVDSCVWITLIEGLEPYRPAIRGALAGLARALIIVSAAAPRSHTGGRGFRRTRGALTRRRPAKASTSCPLRPERRSRHWRVMAGSSAHRTRYGSRS